MMMMSIVLVMYFVTINLCMAEWENGASNNFLAGAGQIVQSNLFLFRHIPFLARQTSIMSYPYKSAPPPPFIWCLNMKQVNFQSSYCTWALISMQEKWNAWYSKISITFVWKFAMVVGNFMTIANHLLKVLGLVVKYPPFFSPFSQMPVILNL